MQVQRQPAQKYKSKPIKTLENSLPVGKSKLKSKKSKKEGKKSGVDL